MRPIRLTTLLAVLAACTGGPEAPTEEVTPLAEPRHPSPTTGSEALSGHMQDHFDLVLAARNAVIRGDLEGARSALESLAEHPTAEGLPEGWEPYVAELRTRAGEATVGNAEQAGRAVAIVAAQCGVCHAANGATLPVDLSPPPPEGGTKGHMARHVWAVGRMWDSIVAPNPAAWEWAARVLDEDGNLTEVDRGAGVEPLSDETRVYAERVHKLADAGMRSTSSSARAELYGQVVASCAECHTRLGVDPFANREP